MLAWERTVEHFFVLIEHFESIKIDLSVDMTPHRFKGAISDIIQALKNVLVLRVFFYFCKEVKIRYFLEFLQVSNIVYQNSIDLFM